MAAKYNVGDIVDGYEFMGGDYRDRANWQDWGDGARKLPDGSVVRTGPRGGMQFLRKATTGQGGEPLREFEVNAAARAALMDEGQREYERAKADGYDPTSFRNSTAYALEAVPFAGSWMADVLRDNAGERARAAELQFTDGALRTTTGANAPEPEVRRASRAYFRQPGESQGVERNKQLIRDRFRQTAVKAAGRAYVPAAPGASRPAAPKAAVSAYDRMRSGFDTKQPYGTQANPFLARDMDTLNRLPKGSYVIDPSGNFGVIE
ncbi:MAG: hypothetical protein DI570_23805 [Phenylobacterium zucineum]|nr:MAG: hypothetical protein DI570_23805 [Phenylobacterium zucineum]